MFCEWHTTNSAGWSRRCQRTAPLSPVPAQPPHGPPMYGEPRCAKTVNFCMETHNWPSRVTGFLKCPSAHVPEHNKAQHPCVSQYNASLRFLHTHPRLAASARSLDPSRPRPTEKRTRSWCTDADTDVKTENYEISRNLCGLPSLCENCWIRQQPSQNQRSPKHLWKMVQMAQTLAVNAVGGVIRRVETGLVRYLVCQQRKTRSAITHHQIVLHFVTRNRGCRTSAWWWWFGWGRGSGGWW